MGNELIEEESLIFGAGIIAKRFYQYLWFSKQDVSLIKGFVVSHKTGNPDTLFDRQVFLVDELEEGDLEKKVFVAISDKQKDEVERLLREKGFRRVVLVGREELSALSNVIADFFQSVPLKRNRIFFECFDGAGYACNCKYIAEALLRKRKDLELVWCALDDKAAETVPKEIKVVIKDSIEYIEERSLAKVMVTNNNFPEAVRKRKNQYYINTWHGMGPHKKVGLAVHQVETDRDDLKEYVKETFANADLMIAGSDFSTEVYRKAFLYQGEIGYWGYPRNDILFTQVDRIKEKIYREYQIPTDSRIVLYAPTFRPDIEKAKDRNEARKIYDLDVERVQEALQERFGERFAFFYRFHHRIYRNLNVREMVKNGTDATCHTDMQELLCAADVLITDWSSSMWDFSLMKKPVFLYYHDADEIEETTGFYLHPDKYPYPKGHTTEELCRVIRGFDSDAYQKVLERWITTYGTYDDGHAAERVADRILDVIEYPEKYGRIQ